MAAHWRPWSRGALSIGKRSEPVFPRAVNETYFNCAAQHPLGVHTVRGFERYIDFMHNGPGEGREDFWETGYREMKPAFARLIKAKPEEIAFCAGTTVGEKPHRERHGPEQRQRGHQ